MKKNAKRKKRAETVNRHKLILSIETSCDETAIALVNASGGLRNPRFKVLKNFVSSQIEIHRPFGGVVPNLAKREHLKNLPEIFKNLKLETQNLKLDAIAVTVGPGLEPALWTGIEFAKKLAKDLKKPLLGANHMEGHLFSNLLPQIRKTENPKHKTKNLKIEFPAIALVVSGGHTILLYMTSFTKWKKLGETRDDAAGEAFDKIARLLGLPYPGGPEIQKLAVKGNPSAIDFPRPMLAPKQKSFSGLNQKNPAKARGASGASYEFSFSGLKTSVLYYLRDNPQADKADVAASAQAAIVDVLVKKTMRAAREFRAKSVLLCGGVAANRALRGELRRQTKSEKRKFHVPDFEFNTDNAAMIATAAYIGHLRGKKYRITAQSNLNL